MADDDNDDQNGIAAFESKWAAGFTKIDGRHVAADGLVGRKGQRRILPPGADFDGDGDYLAEVAKAVLSGRKLRVFDELVIQPNIGTVAGHRLMGKKLHTPETLAAELGVPVDRIYREKSEAAQIVGAEVKRRLAEDE